MICPRCDQGSVLEVLIRELQVETFLCDECDAVWFDHIDVENMPFVDFGTYMINKGLNSTWNEIVIVNDNK